MNIKENLQIFEEMASAMEVNGLEVDAQVREYLQEYLAGNESIDAAIERLQKLLVEAKCSL